MAGTIKAILGTELVNGSSSNPIYPVTSDKAVYDENDIPIYLSKNLTSLVNISSLYTDNWLTNEATIVTVATAISLVPSINRRLGYIGTIRTANTTWKLIQYIGNNLNDWTTLANWNVYTLGEGYMYGGEIIPTSLSDTTLVNAFYIPSFIGTYINYGNITISDTNVIIVKTDSVYSTIYLDVISNNYYLTDKLGYPVITRTYYSKYNGNLINSKLVNSIKIPCIPSDIIKIYNSAYLTNTYNNVEFYKSDNTWINSGISSNEVITLDSSNIPTDTSYIRIHFTDSINFYVKRNDDILGLQNIINSIKEHEEYITNLQTVKKQISIIGGISAKSSLFKNKLISNFGNNYNITSYSSIKESIPDTLVRLGICKLITTTNFTLKADGSTSICASNSTNTLLKNVYTNSSSNVLYYSTDNSSIVYINNIECTLTCVWNNTIYDTPEEDENLYYTIKSNNILNNDLLVYSGTPIIFSTNSIINNSSIIIIWLSSIINTYDLLLCNSLLQKNCIVIGDVIGTTTVNNIEETNLSKLYGNKYFNIRDYCIKYIMIELGYDIENSNASNYYGEDEEAILLQASGYNTTDESNPNYINPDWKTLGRIPRVLVPDDGVTFTESAYIKLSNVIYNIAIQLGYI